MPLTATGSQLPWHAPGAAEEDRCCCGGCCMYPYAQFSDGVAPPDDLPASLPLGEIFLELDIGAIAYYGDGAPPVGPDDETTRVLRPTATAWELATEFGHVIHTSPCLIVGDGAYVPGDDIIEDQFAATYHISGLLSGFGIADFDVVRVSLCQWSYSGTGMAGDTPFDFDCVLRYEASLLPDSPDNVWPDDLPRSGGWTIDFVGFGAPTSSYKLGYMHRPDDDGGSAQYQVWDSGSWATLLTVS